MIPTAVARLARANLLDYLETTYGLSDHDLERALLDYLAGPEGLFRGPYLDIRLPFRRARADAVQPLQIAPDFSPYRHQMRAFERLHGQRGHQPQHTLITTGTGSGKTECFLYPILDHCWRERERGRRGVKAVLIYPMNALATDQARRMAQTLWDDSRLKGNVTAGLYVGGKGSHRVADREHLIDDRRILRQAPPDILLTNYKMLDFLLLRPEDQTLWKENARDTLRFLVLDELHTYDGAQGSDIACLIRRLKTRLETPAGGLCCIGTSATIGADNEDGAQRLTRFATEVFDEAFLSDSVITEDRLDVEEALGTRRDLEDHPTGGDLGDLDPLRKDADAWLARQKELWLGSDGGSLSTVEVGARLTRHDFLHQLLRALSGRVRSVGELIERLALREEWFADMDTDGRELVVDSFVALVSHAKRRGGPDEGGHRPKGPFLSVQVQLWLREIRDLVRSVEPEVRFRWRSEMGGRAALEDDRSRHLPMVRCRECGCVGLASVQRDGETRLRDDSEEREIGRKWLRRSPEARFVAFGHGSAEGQQILPEYLCPRCLRIGQKANCDCEGPSRPPGLPVRVARDLTADRHPRFRPVCPDCGADDSLIFLASRASSLLSVAVSHLFQTSFNDDPKLLAFVDSVQDASHRAGFFGARTYRFNLRSLVQHALQSLGGRLPLEDAATRLLEHTERRLHGPKRAIPVLVPEDLRNHPDYERFLERRGMGRHDDLRDWLLRRLSLEIAFEYGFSVRSGRSLEKTGCSTLEVDPEGLDRAAQALGMILEEEGCLQSRQARVGGAEARHFLAGLVNRLRLRGGIQHELLQAYVEHSGNRFFLSKKRNPLGPVFGPESVLPRFLLKHPPRRGRRSAFDAFGVEADRLTWHRDWAARSLGLAPDDDGISDLYGYALDCLETVGILQGQQTADGTQAWSLDPRSLTLVSDVRELTCPACNEVVRLPSAAADTWSGHRCTKYRCTGSWGVPVDVPESFYTRIFREGRVARVFPEEHTGLLQREQREQVEEQFKTGEAPDAPNLLVCTPTLEMGIDIGDLSAVLLCSVPPTTANYLQRIGRAGRATGNALCLTLANSRPHDLYFHADPLAMMAGTVDPPGCFLDAPEMLKRQVVAHAMDAWARQETEIAEIPGQMTAVLTDGARFPARFLDHYAEHAPQLTADFLARFDQGALSEASREELQRFALSDGVAERIHGAFDEVRRERMRLKRLQENARKRVEELDAESDLPADEIEFEKAEATASHKMLGRLIVELGKRYPLNVLTDAGILPNYAFPEPGVELESVIRSDVGGKREYQAHAYMRPASIAIRELAPFNTFYAEGRRVRVDEIDLGTPGQPLIETWRLCAACTHSAREEGDAAPVAGCPACGDTRWTDVDQRRKLVYFRRSRSLATRLEAASADEGDERERTRYQTHDLIDVRPDNRSGARLIESLPFGFELLTRLVLREVNFGPDVDLASFDVAGHQVNDEGFEVCLDCGRVRPDSGEPLDHTPMCRTRKGKTPRLENVYLYRQVESEAIRLLLPVADLELESQQASFKAALELGMRRRYGGRAPHLRIKSMREPIRGGGHRNYLVIFDTVPGGTGYLTDLWREDAVLDVLADALSALRGCPCLAEDKDGCYRCLFAYQNQRELQLTSSAAARKLLEGILLARVSLRDVDTLSDVSLDSKLESELEERFIRALVGQARRRGHARKILKEGEERWELSLDGIRWEVRPQVRLGSRQGVSVNCQPDFLIVPVSVRSDRRSVAVFCDGHAYHVQPDKATSRVGDDVEKRRAILDSGRYLVWSVTWQDVEEFEGDLPWTGSGLLNTGHSQPGQAVIRQWKLEPRVDLAGLGNMELLWRWLRQPDESAWLRGLAVLGADWVVRMQTVADEAIEQIERELAAGRDAMTVDAEPVSVTAQTTVLGQLESRFGVRLLGRIGMEAVKGSFPRLPAWTLRLYDDQIHRKDEQFLASWRAFLQALNLLQFVEGFVFASTEDIARRVATGVDVQPLPRPYAGASIAAETPPRYEPDSDPLEGMELLDDERPFVAAVLAAGGPRPDVGFELADRQGRCIGDAALAWSQPRVAVLIDGTSPEIEAFEQAGWRVFADGWAVDQLVAAVCEGEGS